ncbi:MAG: COR domain-containing protein, partial [Cyanobacteriota bacterium]|nr:COR domain-containing protein [Cyanobacteriota bacterium]
QHYISNLPHIGSAIPKTWKKVREILETDSRNYISLTEYLSICENNGFKKQGDKLQLSGYLHDLGVCLHFQDDPLLNKTVILKPEWGTAAVYKALDNPKVQNNFGRFTKDDLTNIWHENKYANMHDELLQLMIKFKLCYKIPGTSQTYIAPQLLTEAQPAYNWDENNNLILRYTYEFMPKGIITQFIVAMHEDIENQKYVWKSGVILKKNQTRAEVIEYYSKREIKIRISGQQKRDLMTIVTHELDKIHSSYNNRLKYNKLIPCNCAACKNSQNPHFYKFDKLNEWKSNGRQKTNCDNYPYDEVDIRSLIDDVIDRDMSREFFQVSHPRNYTINNSSGSVIHINDNQIIGSQTMTQKFVNDQSRKIENQGGNVTGNVLGDESNITAKVTGNYPQPETEEPKKLGFLEAEKILNDQSRKIENKNGNVLGDESNITAKVTGNSPQPETEKLKKLGFLEVEKNLNDQSRKIENQGGNVLGDESNITAKVTGNSPQPETEKLKKLGFLEVEKILNDQSRKIENKNGNVTGNVLGDESHITAKVTGNSPQPEKQEPKKFGFLDFLSWMQNGQILYYLGSAILGVILLIIYPKLFPSGFPKLVEKIQDVFSVPQVEKELDKNR